MYKIAKKKSILLYACININRKSTIYVCITH